MFDEPEKKYIPYCPINLADRTWPDTKICKPPVWLSTDLRDGNQALIEPMSVEKKTRMFKMLVEIGMKQIEIAFPSSSQTEYAFVRKLIEEQLIPDDVVIQVLTPARRDLIERTIESVKDASKVIIHMYIPIAPAWQKIVLNTNNEGIIDLALDGTRIIKELTAKYNSVQWSYQLGLESFSASEPGLALDLCNAVIELWQPDIENKITLNLAATVEIATPNVFADQIEWMGRNLAKRDKVIIAVHPHNDRGTAIAAAELALMAGAEKVEGCLFGNGERTGNVDLVTLALNLYSQGIHPGLDFSNIDAVRHVIEECNQIKIHERHPYVGDLVFTSFSGTHQNAIKKGMELQKEHQPWMVPYLPIDPKDLGRTYESVIRLNSQSGKGGVSFILKRDYGIELPCHILIEFSRLVKLRADTLGHEMKSKEIYGLFVKEYLNVESPWSYHSHLITRKGKQQLNIETEICVGSKVIRNYGSGNGPLNAFINSLDKNIELADYQQHSLNKGADSKAICYVELHLDSGNFVYGIGVDDDMVIAAFKAVLCGLNRQHKLEQR